MKKTTITKVLIISLMIFAKENLMAQWNGTNPNPIWTNQDVGIGLSNPLRQLHLKLENCQVWGEQNFFDRFDNPFRITRVGGGDIVMGGSPPIMNPRMINCKFINWDMKVNAHDISQTFNVNGTDKTGNPFDINMFQFGFSDNISQSTLSKYFSKI